MTEAADLILRNGRVYALTEGSIAEDPAEPDAEAVAIRDGEIVRVAADYEIEFLEGVGTEVIDLDGRTLLPGFIDAHTHLAHEGMAALYADLSAAEDLENALDRLRSQVENARAGSEDGDEDTGAAGGDWIVGVGYDESTWPDEAPTREALDRVSTERPVAAVRVDMHTAVLNSVALDRHRDEMADEHVRTAGGDPTGVVVEGAVGVVEPVFDPSVEATRELVEAAIDRATSRGITCAHDKVKESHAPRIYRELDLAGDLDLRVRIDYWRHHLDAVLETGLRTNHGSDLVEVGAIKTFTDGAIGGRTAKLSEPYADAGTEAPDHPRGQWVVEPDAFHDLVERADGEGLQVAAHAIGDEAIDLAVDAFADASGDRHRIEHAELATDDAIRRMAEAGVVASMQPNFHRWAREGGLYETALGEERTRRSNRLRAVRDAGVPLAFGSDCMPMDPLLGIHHAVNAPTDEQSLSVGEALRAYTHGGAYAAFDEDRLGTIESGKRADLVALDESPWARAGTIDELGVDLTIVDARVVHDER